MNKQDIIDKHKKIVDEHFDNFHPPFHSSEYTDWSKSPNIPLGNIPELKIIELLKDINIITKLIFYVLCASLGTLIAIAITT